ncbi:MAG: YdcF family protein [Oleispira sp.]|nr:YdcF family protein [Oleispira sp.]
MELGFLLKKLISMWLMPLPFCCLIILLGLVLSFWRAHFGRAIAFSGVAFLMLFSWQPFATSVLYPLEHQYPSFDIKQPVDAIVVLGNCHTVSEEIPPMAQLCGTGLYRLMEGYRIWQANPEAELLLSGYAAGQSLPYAEVTGNIALSLGIPENKIRLFSSAKDTQEEAELTAPFLIDKTFALVTSASHMQRSMRWFQQQGVAGKHLQPIPAPAHFGAPKESSDWKIGTKALLKTERTWYELLGKVWAAIKG